MFNLNNTIFYFFYNLSHYQYVAKIALFLSYPVYYGLALVVLWALFFSKKKMFNFSLFFLSGFTTWFTANALKLVFETSRPYTTLNLIPLFYENSFSFPSVHSAVSASLALSAFLINKKLGICMSLAALLIGISRIIIGVHYPVDVLGGWVVGTLIGFLYTHLFRKI